jgi:hypothetical protein
VHPADDYYYYPLYHHQAARAMTQCQKNNYTKGGCKWDGGNTMAGLFLSYTAIANGLGRNLIGEQFSR